MHPNDIPTVSSWIVTTPLWQRYGLSAADTQTNLENALHRSDMLLVADIDSQVHACGFSWCLLEGAFGRSAYLRLIGVREDHTGAGIGTRLLIATEQRAAASSRDIFLLVSDFNVDAQRFYQRHGYQQIGAIPGYVLPDVTEYIYWKRLGEFR